MLYISPVVPVRCYIFFTITVVISGRITYTHVFKKDTRIMLRNLLVFSRYRAI
jgi:hypothetical protein